MLKHTYSK